MLGFLKRAKKPYALSDEGMTRWALINERKDLRDQDLKLLRTTITKRRKEVAEMFAKDVIGPMEHQRQLDTLNIIEKHALDVVFLRNRERMQELGAPKQRRGQSKLHGVEISFNDGELEKQTDEDKQPEDKLKA